MEMSFGLKALSTGEMLRAAVEGKTDLGQQVEKIMASGDLVPDDLIVSMVAQKIMVPDCINGVVLDGFPRTLVQAKLFENVLSEINLVIDLVILFKADDDTIINRTSGRFSCAKCGETYHKTSKPLTHEGMCDVCGGAQFRRRADDNFKAIQHRLNDYHILTEPLLPFFQKKNILKSVDATAEISDLKHEINLFMNTL